MPPETDREEAFPEEVFPDEISGEDEYTVVTTYFATDRNFTGAIEPREMFGSERGSLRYGTADVSIPRDHEMGELESPFLGLRFLEDPEDHVVLLEVSHLAYDAFFRSLADRVNEDERRSALLFVHGFNVTFEEAARRTAQMTYDLVFDGAPVFYAWPSQGTIPAYTVDEQSVEWAESNIRGFLADFLSRSDAENVYLIAHSMGSRGLSRALVSLLNDQPELGQRITEVILAAPDIDAEVFKRDIAPSIIASGRPLTLYASSEDRALAASREIHGAPRAGDSGNDLVLIAGLETIDASGVDSSFLRHSYYAETRAILSDMYYLIREDRRPDQRFGIRRVSGDPVHYWEFRP